MEESQIKVNVFKNDIRMIEYLDIRIIRIKSEKYNLFIMKNYWPLIGELKGSVYLEGKETISFENVDAFYSLSHNVFNLIIKGNI